MSEFDVPDAPRIADIPAIRDVANVDSPPVVDLTRTPEEIIDSKTDRGSQPPNITIPPPVERRGTHFDARPGTELAAWRPPESNGAEVAPLWRSIKDIFDLTATTTPQPSDQRADVVPYAGAAVGKAIEGTGNSADQPDTRTPDDISGMPGTPGKDLALPNGDVVVPDEPVGKKPWSEKSKTVEVTDKDRDAARALFLARLFRDSRAASKDAPEGKAPAPSDADQAAQDLPIPLATRAAAVGDQGGDRPAKDEAVTVAAAGAVPEPPEAAGLKPADQPAAEAKPTVLTAETPDAAADRGEPVAPPQPVAPEVPTTPPAADNVDYLEPRGVLRDKASAEVPPVLTAETPDAAADRGEPVAPPQPVAPEVPTTPPAADTPFVNPPHPHVYVTPESGHMVDGVWIPEAADAEHPDGPSTERQTRPGDPNRRVGDTPQAQPRTDQAAAAQTPGPPEVPTMPTSIPPDTGWKRLLKAIGLGTALGVDGVSKGVYAATGVKPADIVKIGMFRYRIREINGRVENITVRAVNKEMAAIIARMRSSQNSRG